MGTATPLPEFGRWQQCMAPIQLCTYTANETSDLALYCFVFSNNNLLASCLPVSLFSCFTSPLFPLSLSPGYLSSYHSLLILPFLLLLNPLSPPGSCSHYTDCCDGGYCAGYPPNCFCDHDCHSRGDCCRDVADICPECKNICSTT